MTSVYKNKTERTKPSSAKYKLAHLCCVNLVLRVIHVGIIFTANQGFPGLGGVRGGGPAWALRPLVEKPRARGEAGVPGEPRARANDGDAASLK